MFIKFFLLIYCHNIDFLQVFSFVTILPPNLLVKVDRASMSCSLETRAPFLDVRLIQAAWKIPSRNKIKNKIVGTESLIIKRIVSEYKELIKKNLKNLNKISKL